MSNKAKARHITTHFAGFEVVRARGSNVWHREPIRNDSHKSCCGQDMSDIVAVARAIDINGLCAHIHCQMSAKRAITRRARQAMENIIEETRIQQNEGIPGMEQHEVALP